MNNRPTSPLLWLVLVIVTASSVLAGCGQRGPLYLPEEAEEQEEQAY
ncbi:MAG: lipoprotein [Thiohalobacterales bacterium]